jgi:hypothetical protein
MTCDFRHTRGVVALSFTFGQWRPNEGGVPSSSLAELSGLLWREREVLDQLLELLRAGSDDGESDGLLHSISGLELHRAITAREVAVELGLEGEPSLEDLIERSDEEWATVLAGHRRALQALSDDVRSLLRRVPASAVEGNVYAFPAAGGRTLQRSLRDFLS